jgi:parallel beta-helix repeat protein
VISNNIIWDDKGGYSGNQRHGLSLEATVDADPGGFTSCVGNTVQGAKGYGIEVSCNTCTVMGNTVRDCGFAGLPGIALTCFAGVPRNDISIANNVITDCYSSIALWGLSTATPRRIVVSGNNCYGKSGATGGGYAGMHVEWCDGVTLSNNRFENHRLAGLYIYKSNNIDVHDNAVIANNYSGTAGSGGVWWVHETGQTGRGLGINRVQGNTGADYVLSTDGGAWVGSDLRLFGLPTTLPATTGGLWQGSTGAVQAAAQAGTTVASHKLPDQAAKSTAYTLAVSDSGTRIPGTGTWTLTVPSAGTLGNGFSAEVVNTGSGTITVDGPGVTNPALAANESIYIFVSGGVLYGPKSTLVAL